MLAAACTRRTAQRLRSSFASSGVTISSGAARVVLRASGVGAGGSLTSVGPAAPIANGNSVAYSHAGLTEWYTNGPLGLEQGFTVRRAPAGAGVAPLTIALSLAGDTHVAAATRGGGIVFSRRGSRIAYQGLSAVDAKGRHLQATMALVGARILLTVDAQHAAYPVRIDPWVSAVVPHGFAAAENFGEGEWGWRVAISGDGNTLLVSAPADAPAGVKTGAAWVFARVSGGWKEQAFLTGGSEQVGPLVRFGSGVALSEDGNTALVGGSGDNGAVGAAWVFTRSGSTWTQQGPKLTSGGSTFALFGQSVALSADGSTALIGATFAGSGGAAYVFTRSGGSWTQQGELTGAGEVGSGRFGESVALSGDGNTALVGGPWDNEKAGAAWFFTRTGTAWSAQGAKIAGGAEFDLVGQSVALSRETGNTALIGAFGSNDAYVYTREGSAWTQQADLKGAEANAFSRFGSAVSLSSSGDTALVGARNDPGEGKGAAYVFQRVGSHWSQEGSKLTGNDVGPGLFGESVSLTGNGDFAVVGAPFAQNSLPTGWVYGFESSEPPEIISASNVDEALFTAAGTARMSNVREGLTELILEKGLQQLYTDEAKLSQVTAEQYIGDMRASLASSTAPSKASLQLMAGNQRVIALLATLEAPYGKPSKELPPAAKLAITHLASVALAGSSAIYAKAETPKYFEPLADERANLTYTTFSPDTVLRATWELAQRNALYAQTRDDIWKASTEESVFSGWEALFAESKVLSNSAFAALKQELKEGGGALLKTRKQIEQLFSEGQTTTQEQMCAHGGTEEPIGNNQPLHGDTIPGVPRLESAAAHCGKPRGRPRPPARPWPSSKSRPANTRLPSPRRRR